jgi:replicative DNA helicase
MAIDDKLKKPLQESLLSLLCYFDKEGGIVARMVKAEHFEGDYYEIASRCIRYHEAYRKAPADHIDDICADLLRKRDDNRHITTNHIIVQMLRLKEGGINIDYLMDEVRKFSRLQRTRTVLLDASQRLAAREEMALEEVEQLLHDLLRIREQTVETGMRLRDLDRLFAYMGKHASEFSMGITQLDARRIAPARGTAMLLLGPPGVGKSWWLIHIGRTALISRLKVLHVTLEMSEEQCTQRYLQNLFSIGVRETRTTVTRLTEVKNGDPPIQHEFNERMDGQFRFRGNDDNFTAAREELEARLHWSGGKLSNLIIKRWAPGTLTMNELVAHIDMLAMTENFVPDILIIDYLGLMKLDKGKTEHRHALGQTLVDLRGFAVERNIAVVAAQQVSREGARSAQVDSTHVAEDWSLVGTADIVATISRSTAEKELGMCRLFFSKVRGEADGFGVVLTQNYALGQFVIDSIPMTPKYHAILSDITREKESEDEPDDPG